MNILRRNGYVNAIAVGCIITVLACIAFLSTRELYLPKLLELKSYDIRMRWRGVREPSGKVAIVGVDDRTIQALGSWPLPRIVYAELIVRLHEAGVKTVGFDVIFADPELNPRTGLLSELRDRFMELELLRPDDNSRVFLDEVSEAIGQADNDAVLASVVEEAGNVVLGAAFVASRGEGSGEDPPCLSKSAYHSVAAGAARVPGSFTPSVYNVAMPPFPALCDAAAGIGFVNSTPDIDGAIRRAMMVLRKGNRFHSPLAVQIVRRHLGLEPADVVLHPGSRIDIGPFSIPIDRTGMSYINYLGPVNTIPIHSLVDVLDGTVGREQLEGKIVLVGGTAVGLGDLWPNPFSDIMWGVEKQATVIENTIHHGFLTRPAWTLYAEIGLMLAAGLILSFVLPLLRHLWSIPFAAAVAAGFCAFNQYMFEARQVWLSLVYPMLGIASVFSGVFAYKYLTEERQKREIRNAFTQYMTKSLVERILENPDMLKLGGEKREMTVVFSDIRGFTSISESLDPERLVQVLNEYFDTMTETVFAHEGTLDKYIGDAMMVFYGAPVEQPDHAVRACRTALEMMRAMKALQEKWTESGLPTIRVGIGINTGPMVVGNMGSRKRFDYTVMGDAVNLASRLEGQTKPYGVDIIVGERTCEHTKELFHYRLLDLIRVKGKLQPVRIYELLEEKTPHTPTPHCIPWAEEAFEAYLECNWEEAVECCDKILKETPNDRPAQVLRERCTQLAQTPPKEGWDGVNVKAGK